MAKVQGIQIQDSTGVGFTRDGPRWDGRSAGHTDTRWYWGGAYQGRLRGREYRSKTVLGWGLPGIVPDGMAKVLGIQIQDSIGVGLTRDSPRWDGQSTGNTDPKRWGLPGIVPDGMGKVLGIQIQNSTGAGLTRDSPRWDGQSAGNTDPRQCWGGAYQG